MKRVDALFFLRCLLPATVLLIVLSVLTWFSQNQSFRESRPWFIAFALAGVFATVSILMDLRQTRRTR